MTEAKPVISSETIIYCDMDGVLADFDRAVIEKLGSKLNDNWGDLDPDLFLTLKKTNDADILWEFISKLNIEILSAAPKPERGEVASRAAKDKKAWMNEHFNFPADKVHVGLRREKPNRAKRFDKESGEWIQNILIDDTQGNIEAWEQAGGIGILHVTGDSQSTITKLEQMGV